MCVVRESLPAPACLCAALTRTPAHWLRPKLSAPPFAPDHTRRLDWHKAGNQRLRCLRITTKEERAVRGKLQVRRGWRLCWWAGGQGWEALELVPKAAGA